MEQAALIEKQDYENYKEELKRKLDETSENFIVIGYILKQVRDRRLYLNDGYSDIYGFGLGEYGLSKATVSRFMNINTKFSIGGNSRGIRPEYRGYGRSKIQEMLNVDEGDMELVTADTTVGQVKELKKAESAQKQIEKEERENSLPLVRMAAGPEEKGEKHGLNPMDPFESVMTAFWEENEGLYRRVAAGLATPEIIAEEISPSGCMTYRRGVNIVFFYDIEKGLKLRSYEKGKAEITPYTYRELIDRTMKLDMTGEHGKTAAAPDIRETQDSLPDGQPATYVPVTGQTSVSDQRDVMPDVGREDAAGENTDTAGGGDMTDVIDGEYRELEEVAAGWQAIMSIPYTDDEIRRAIEYFDFEYLRMVGLHMDGLKKMCYKVAGECIRKCYKSIAEQADRGRSGTGV